MNQKLLLFAAFILPFLGCRSENSRKEQMNTQNPAVSAGKMKAIVENAIELDSIPSGSGLVRSGKNFYLISDDSPYFFKLDPQFRALEKIAIPNFRKTRDFRISKKTKPDYESACLGKMNGETYLLAFGSGSQSPERDSLLLVNLNHPENGKTYSMRPILERIKTAANLSDSDINLEGSAIIGEELFLFNRGKNVLAKINWPKTLSFLAEKGKMPEIKIWRIKLPQIKGIDPGFSGACQLGNENKLLFTASVENTPNWIDDGEILGSFIGILNLEKLETAPLEKIALLTDPQQKTVIEKVESVEFLHRKNNKNINLLCLTDDDKGGSKILEITLEF